MDERERSTGGRRWRMAAGYLVGAASILTVAGWMSTALPLPAWWYPLTVGAVALGFPVARMLGWMQA